MLKAIFSRAGAPRKDRGSGGSRGWIDAVREDAIEGWYIDRNPGVKDNRFNLGIDGQDFGVHYAAEPRADVEVKEGVRHCGFRVQLTGSSQDEQPMIGRFSDGAPHRVTLRDLAGRLIAERELIIGPPLKGNLERCDATGLSGWVIDGSSPDEPVELEVSIDGDFLCGLRTSRLRQDVSSAHRSGEHAGFHLDWPLGMLPSGTVVDVKVRSTGQPVPNSPGRIADIQSPVVSRRYAYLQHLHPPRAAIVIPACHSIAAISECLDSVLRWLPHWASVLLVHDASTGPVPREWVDRLRASRSEVLSVSGNLGFFRSINCGIVHAPDCDVIVLHGGAKIHRGCLEALRYVAYATSKVATVTPLWNPLGGAYSRQAAEEGDDAVVPMSDEDVARLAAVAGEGRFLEVPRGITSCMYIRRDAILSLGLFDENKYRNRGAEGSDFCMRAWRRGWRNIVCDKAILIQKESSSVGSDCEALDAQAAAQLTANYPEYEQSLSRLTDVEFAYVHMRIRKALTSGGGTKAFRVLYVIATQIGGTPQTNLDLMLEMSRSFGCWLLHCDGRTITLSRLSGHRLEVREKQTLSRPIEPITHRSDEYDSCVMDMIYRHSIDLVHVRHIAWHSLGLSAAAKRLGVAVIYSIHDFYSVCLSHNLIDDRSMFCGGVCTRGDGNCRTELWEEFQVSSLKHRFVHRWREMFSEFAKYCDHFITTAPSSAAWFLRFYPELAPRLSVIPHGRDFEEFCTIHPSIQGPLRVVVPGNIGVSKGAGVIRRIIESDLQGQIEFHFLGTTCTELKHLGVHHGAYARHDFARRMREISPHVGLALSIWPETYCHTLTEMWSCGTPVLAFDLGALGERIRASGGGWLLPATCGAEQVVSALNHIRSDPAGLDQRRRAVQVWQRGEGGTNTSSRMAAAYEGVYRRLLASNGGDHPPK